MATKRMVYERKMARQASKARKTAPLPGRGDDTTMMPGSAEDLVPSSPPSPQASADMAAGGIPLARGNSDRLPMTPEGHAQIAGVGQALAAQGGPDEMVSSTSRRSQETTQDVQAQSPKPIPTTPAPGLESHALGNVEGMPKGAKMKSFLRDLLKKNSDARIPGQGALSTKPAETFNEYRVRGLSAVRGLMAKLASNPHEKILASTSTSVVKLVAAAVAKGMPDDMSISAEEFLKELPTGPGTMFRFAPGPTGDWSLKPFDPQKEPFSPGAIYFLLHGDTAESTKEGPVDARQKARATIVKHVLTKDWPSAEKAAHAAAAAGLGDDEIQGAIDEALPDAQGMAGLSPHHQMAAMAAASDSKRSELRPIIRQTFGDLSGVSPDAAVRIKSHLGRIGA